MWRSQKMLMHLYRGGGNEEHLPENWEELLDEILEDEEFENILKQ